MVSEIKKKCDGVFCELDRWRIGGSLGVMSIIGKLKKDEKNRAFLQLRERVSN